MSKHGALRDLAEWTLEWTKSYRHGTTLIERLPAQEVHLRTNVPEASAKDARTELAVFFAQAGAVGPRAGGCCSPYAPRALTEPGRQRPSGRDAASRTRCTDALAGRRGVG